MPTAGFESTISAGERPQSYVLDCAATGTDESDNYNVKIDNIRKTVAILTIMVMV
jgi:hypothetical protein